MGDPPATIPFARVREALEGLGVEIENTRSVEFGIHGVTVTRARVLDGRLLTFGPDVATVTTTIGYDREGEF